MVYINAFPHLKAKQVIESLNHVNPLQVEERMIETKKYCKDG